MKAEDFSAKRKSGYFLESQKVFQYYYGTPKKKVEELLTKGRNVLLCIDVKGARLVAREFPDALKIFIKPPSAAELKKRLQRRATEGHEDLRLRLATARREMKESVRYDHVIINDNLDDAYGDLESVVCSALPAFGGGLPGAKKKF
jgi:guanylate kinase